MEQQRRFPTEYRWEGVATLEATGMTLSQFVTDWGKLECR
jgi:hypothetical protein